MNIKAINAQGADNGISISDSNKIATIEFFQALIAVIQTYLETVQSNYNKSAVQDKKNEEQVQSEKSTQKGHDQVVMEENRAVSSSGTQGNSSKAINPASSLSSVGNASNGGILGTAPSYA